ncbi:MAG: holo-ACP synthase [Clostridia bacterium]|nr:holo-ACP synthase [Clostridia bacterium]
MRVGIDLVDVSRFSGERFTPEVYYRLFTPKERDHIESVGSVQLQHERMAGKFAAKEAVVKMLGFGINKGISWQDIEILPNDLGKPVLTLFNGALKVYTDLRLHHADISISHTAEFATAICIAEE